jgi:hypothetical protein
LSSINGSITAGVAAVPTIAHPPVDRLCEECDQPIPQKRLRAVPTATLCVPCLEAQGDVPKIKRYDETAKDGEIIQTVFTRNRTLESAIRRVNTIAPPDQAYAMAVGDDYYLRRDEEHSVGSAYAMNTMFEEDEEVEQVLTPKTEVNTPEPEPEIEPYMVPTTDLPQAHV